MTKIFCSFAYTGEDQKVVEARMKRLVATLEEDGHDVYCQLFDEDTAEFTEPKQFLERTLAVLADYDTVLVIMTSPRRSEGQLIEIGAALVLHKRLVVAQHESSVGVTYVPTLAEASATWKDDDELNDVARRLCD